MSELGVNATTGRTGTLAKASADAQKPHRRESERNSQGPQYGVSQRDMAYELGGGLDIFFCDHAKNVIGRTDSDQTSIRAGFKNRWDWFDFLNVTLSLSHPT